MGLVQPIHGRDKKDRAMVAKGDGSRRGRARRFATWARLLAPGAVLVVLLLGVTQPAAALSARGHTFLESFGAPGGGAGELNQPRGVAVNEATGDIYVVDAGNERVDRFGPDDGFIEAWGWGVLDGKKEFEHCTSECRPGLAGPGKFEFDEPNEIAVDNSGNAEDPSAGDVYVQARTSEEHQAVDKFTAEGVQIDTVTSAHAEKFEELDGVAVAPDGTLWIANEGDLFVYDDAVENHICPERGKKHTAPCPGFGLLEPGQELDGKERSGLALDGKGSVYVGEEGFGGSSAGPGDRIAKLNVDALAEEAAEAVLLQELDHREALAVAADQETGDVYLAEGNGIAAFDTSGSPIQRFGEGLGQGGLSEARGVAAVSAASPQHPGDVYVSEAAGGRIEVFAPEAPREPAVDDLSAQDVMGEGAQLDGAVAPGGSSTRYFFEYGPTSCAGSPGACLTLPAPPGAEIAAGCPSAEESRCFFDEPVSAKLTGLSPGTTYHYRLLAANAQGQAGGAEGTFTTGAAEGHDIADGRAWEMVSPLDMNGGEAEPFSEGGGLIQASELGTALTWIGTAPIEEPEGSRSFEPTQLLSTRGAEGWSTQDIVTPNEQGTGLELGSQEYRMFSSTLALSLLEPFAGGGKLAEPPLAPPGTGEAGHQEKTVYLRRDAPLAPSAAEAPNYEQAQANGLQMGNPGFLALVNAGNVLAGAQFGKQVTPIDATPDLSHEVIESEIPLTPGSTAGHNLYEWSGGVLKLINVLPGEAAKPANAAVLGISSTMVRGAISSDGSRVFWAAENHLYMRDTSLEKTLEIDGDGSEEGRAIFQGASADGSSVFFTDEQDLVPAAGAAHGKPDLYVCEIRTVEGVLGCKLTDLTPSGDVVGLMLGSSEDGSSVYLVANGALGAGASPGQCRPEPQPNATCDLYLLRRTGAVPHAHWAPPRFIAAVSNLDNADWEPRRSPVNPDLGEVTSRISPNGRYLAFMSEQSLTGYDNRDAAAAAGGARDEEVFLYDAGTAQLSCVSCDPSGARPRGVFDPPESNPQNEEGWGLVVDRMKIWQGRWLAGNVPGWTKSEHDRALYQSNYLSNSGRLYFQSPADLVPEAVNAKNDVYEYEPAGIPNSAQRCTSAGRTFVASLNGCLGLISSGSSPREAAFLDAGRSGGEAAGGEGEDGGGEVFFLSAGLTASEQGASFSVFDAHECTTARPCLTRTEAGTPTPCSTTEACRPLSVLAPASQTPATASAPRANGNVLPFQTNVKPKPTRQQLLAAALKRCKKDKQHRRRRLCEAAARKRYGQPRKKPASSSAHPKAVQR
jgi:DNA-binding beta-propeller fold protein YncE